MFDEQAFFCTLQEVGLSVAELAEVIGISKVTLYRKVHGESDFTRKEIQICMRIFGKERASAIFFAKEVS